MSHKDVNNEDQLTAERDAMAEAEGASQVSIDDADTEDSTLLGVEAGADADQAVPAELAAVHTDTDSAAQASGMGIPNDEQPAEDTESKPMTKKPATGAKKSAVKPVSARSKRYLEAAAKYDPARVYAPVEALRIVKEMATGKTDQAIEVHIRLLAPKGKKNEGERYRTIATLPHGTGKEPKIGVLDEALIEKIAKAGDTEFDILLATPAMMPKVAKVAKILGPKNKMPNPKTGTVAENIDDAKKMILSGRTEIRADAHHNLHQAIGRASWTPEKLLENFQALRSVLPAHRLQRVVICATFGPGVAVDLAA